ncbi:hypothetical protein ACFSM7_13135 [Clavibacter michiganensis subsp. tessellarius]|uniref:hypothetical protein n=1 Tax=Clavibacter tessellarius TaxID=31965 RepID=UPI00363FEC32
MSSARCHQISGADARRAGGYGNAGTSPRRGRFTPTSASRIVLGRPAWWNSTCTLTKRPASASPVLD